MKIKQLILLLLLFAAMEGHAQTTTLAGTIAADAKYIQVEQLGDFSEGFAAVNNGRTSAIINAKGSVVFPFNKYLIHDKFRKGIIAISDELGNKGGYMNRQFKVIVPLILRWPQLFYSDGYGLNQTDDKNLKDWFYSITPTGKMLPLSRFVNNKLAYYDDGPGEVGLGFHEGFLSFGINVTPNNMKYGYINRSGIVAIPPIYSAALAFHEGLAAVMKIDKNGERKWGFIDKLNKTVIPFTYSNAPDGFSSGLCLVKPLPNNEFDYAYINIKNEIVFKLKLTKENQLEKADGQIGYLFGIQNYDEGNWDHTDIYGHQRNNFQGNYVLWPGKNRNTKLVGKDGSVKDIKEMLGSVGVKTDRYPELELHALIQDEQIIFATAHKFGMLNTDGTLTLPPIFSQLSHFDPVSNLAHAMLYRDQKVIDGYVNRQGVFVIVKQEKSGM